MSRRNVNRERNEKGIQLFMQNLKGVVSFFLASQDIDRRVEGANFLATGRCIYNSNTETLIASFSR